MAQESSSSQRIIFVPNVLRHHGWGHFRRCRDMAITLKRELYLPLSLFADRSTFSVKELLTESQECKILFDLPFHQVVDLAIVDFQQTPLKLYKVLRDSCAVIVGWDEGGKCRHSFSFLVDSLPNFFFNAPNQKNEFLLGLVKTQENLAPLFDQRKDFRRVLVVFGGADPQNLTLKTLGMMKKIGFFTPEREVTVVKGPAAQFHLGEITSPIRLWKSPRNLASCLGQFDLIITSWGLTALEAIACGVPVLLLNPTSYHNALAKKERLACFGIRRPNKKSFDRALNVCLEWSKAYSNKMNYSPENNTASYFDQMTFSSPLCPACRIKSESVIYRTTKKTYYHCHHCSLDFLQTFNLPKKIYSKAYFFEEYKAQYGKTYLEDFSSIQALGLDRLIFAQKKGFHLQKNIPILDVGCAYGPFLKAIHEQGGLPIGLDISSEAVTWVNNQLGFHAICGSFLDFNWNKVFSQKQRPQLITLWFVIEHFENLAQVLAKLAELLPLGGWLALSTPYGKGITRLFDPSCFWNRSPDDHFSIWNRTSAYRLLKRFGFRIRGFRFTGHHPERFPGLKNTKGFRFSAISLFSKILGLGDTFEIYAKKIKLPINTPSS